MKDTLIGHVNIQAASKPHKFTEVRFASFFSGGFITAMMIQWNEEWQNAPL